MGSNSSFFIRSVLHPRPTHWGLSKTSVLSLADAPIQGTRAAFGVHLQLRSRKRIDDYSPWTNSLASFITDAWHQRRFRPLLD
jgi:hypothetical protein